MRRILLLVALACLILTLSACSGRQVEKVEMTRDTIKSVKIVSKNQESKGRFDTRYYVEIEKNQNKAKYRVNDQLFEDISVNSIADVVITSENYIVKVKYVFE